VFPAVGRSCPQETAFADDSSTAVNGAGLVHEEIAARVFVPIGRLKLCRAVLAPMRTLLVNFRPADIIRNPSANLLTVGTSPDPHLPSLRWQADSGSIDKLQQKSSTRRSSLDRLGPGC
jgi:hypothetical protein